MEKIAFNVLGIEDTHVFNCWCWIKSQILVIENVELVHDSNSKSVFALLHYLNIPGTIAKHQRCLENSNQIVISDLCNYENNYNMIWQQIVTKLQKYNIVCLTNNHLLHNVILGHKVCCNDFLFNRTKLYYFESDKVLHYRKNIDFNFWFYEDPSHYVLNNLDNKKQLEKHVISLTRDLQNIRKKLVNYLIDNYEQKCHIGCYALQKFLDHNYNKGYCPVPNSYYDQTFAAVYCESTTMYQSVFHPTEKTFEPLLKATFVLPYSNVNFVQNLNKFYNFLLPNIVDYSYDDIIDDRLDVDPDHKRFKKYLVSVDSMLRMPIQQLQDYMHSNWHIVLHNREIFATRPYDTLIDKL